jgi:hypothetical protein
MNGLSVFSVTSIALMLTATVLPVSAELAPCPPVAALLQSNNPAYTDAMDLAQTLRSHGVVITCMFPSKVGSIFVVDQGGVTASSIEGEVAFRTDRDYFSAFFMPKPQTFADFRIYRLHSDQGYLYSFGGEPRVWTANRFGSAHRTYFFKRDNFLLMADTEEMSRQLARALAVKPESP